MDKKVISAFSSLVMLFMITVPTYASNISYGNAINEDINDDIKVYESKMNSEGEYAKHVSAFEGNLSYYEKNSLYTVSSVVYKTGVIETSFIYNNDPNSIYTSINKGLNKNQGLYISDINFDEIVRQAMSNKNNLKVTDVSKLKQGVLKNGLAESSSSTNIFDEVEEQFGSEYSDRLLATKVKDNVYAKLYGYYNHNITKYHDWLLTALKMGGISLYE
ncbi:hypothetical protein CLTEP_26110 [Clostridium tepidiprofundi DSM 19306]|uniref:Uncharacterized protein n=1 Tax=Clostridium tepidiprofundi DSM 19306 TaxID=1121338 RepID=A0A151AS77_9CLOT|nr:hypothetical protein [Clostridium tepidiprofundi]KYH30504.1 hypothetical protein CLTEP_26110 [Clostridium tepidiprofundi DSM 19306]